MTEQELYNVPVPEKTESYSPVPHQQIIEEVRGNIQDTGLTISNAQYRAARDGQKLIGVYDLTANSKIFNYRLAFRNSYDKSMSVAFVGGTSVMICSNGMVVGETQFIRKHTGSVNEELTDKIHRVIGELDEGLIKAERQANQMKCIALNETSIAELCGRFYLEQEIINSSQLNIIRDQLKNPDHEEFAGGSLWSLYNHTTHALKTTHPVKYVDKYQELHNFVEGEFGLT